MPTLGPPDLTNVQQYLEEVDQVITDEHVVQSAYDAERASQAARCRVPADDVEWPHDLAEALRRRVAHNLALRNLPLGLQAAISEGGVQQTRVGGLDAEAKRLEAPHRKRTVG